VQLAFIGIAILFLISVAFTVIYGQSAILLEPEQSIFFVFVFSIFLSFFITKLFLEVKTLYNLFFSKALKRGVWVVESNHTLRARAIVVRYPDLTILELLRVNFRFRKKGLGSALVGQVTQAEQKPIYLRCHSSVAPFYLRLGFSIIPRHERPMHWEVASLESDRLSSIKYLVYR
jgi:GNAT superfamily N-acetyltransferase